MDPLLVSAVLRILPTDSTLTPCQRVLLLKLQRLLHQEDHYLVVDAQYENFLHMYGGVIHPRRAHFCLCLVNHQRADSSHQTQYQVQAQTLDSILANPVNPQVILDT